MKFRVSGFALVVLLTVAADAAVTWTGLTPSMRCGTRMALDSANQRIIMFGGTTVFFDGRYYNDVWEMPLDSAAHPRWAKLAVSGIPPEERDDVVAVYDPAGERMVMFGGSAGLGSRLNDVWALNLTRGSESWQQLTPSGTPPSARHFCYYIYYPVRRSLIVFGGEDSAGQGNLNDVWELVLDSLVWRQVTPFGTPPSGREDGGAAYETASDRMLIFGGRPGNGFTDEVWALCLTPGLEEWTKLDPGGSGPSARTGFAYAQGGDEFFVSCGWDADDYYNDLYVLDIPTLTWSQINAGGDVPMARRNASGAWDEAGGRFFVFGGEAARGYYLGDLYAVPCRGSVGIEQPPNQLAAPALSIPGVVNGVVRIRCMLTQTGPVSVGICDATGRRLRQVYAGKAGPPGVYLEWDGRDAAGRLVPAGAYYCTVRTGDTTLTRKFVYAR